MARRISSCRKLTRPARPYSSPCRSAAASAAKPPGTGARPATRPRRTVRRRAAPARPGWPDPPREPGPAPRRRWSAGMPGVAGREHLGDEERVAGRHRVHLARVQGARGAQPPDRGRRTAAPAAAGVPARCGTPAEQLLQRVVPADLVVRGRSAPAPPAARRSAGRGSAGRPGWPRRPSARPRSTSTVGCPAQLSSARSASSSRFRSAPAASARVSSVPTLPARSRNGPRAPAGGQVVAVSDEQPTVRRQHRPERLDQADLPIPASPQTSTTEPAPAAASRAAAASSATSCSRSSSNRPTHAWLHADGRTIPRDLGVVVALMPVS